jgi:hypothetical protein
MSMRFTVLALVRAVKGSTTDKSYNNEFHKKMSRLIDKYKWYKIDKFGSKAAAASVPYLANFESLN